MVAQMVLHQTKQVCNAYKWWINLLEILRNNLRNTKITHVIVFGIKIDTKNFSFRLSNKKLEKAFGATSKLLAMQFVTFLDI